MALACAVPVLAIALHACALGAAPAGRPEPPVRTAMLAAQTHFADHEAEVVLELRQLLSLPNDAAHPPDIRRNAEQLVAMLERRDVRAGLLETPGVAPAVFGEILTPGAERTLLFYAHFDGQPLGDEADWATPAFEPALRNGRLEDGAAAIAWRDARYPLSDEARIYARSASDDKAPIVALLAALDALRAADIPLSANIKFFFEGEEEAGSPNLARVLNTHRRQLQSDIWIFADGPIDPSGVPRVALGVRGLVSFRVTVFGPAGSVHSGHYGNVAPNPAARLARLITSMRAENGAITIAGFERAADSITRRTRALARAAFNDAEMLSGPQLPASESGRSYGESVLGAAINVTQLSYGGAGQPRNAIDPQASAAFDLRLAPGVAIEEAREFIAHHIRGQGYHLVDATPTEAERFTYRKLARLEWAGAQGYPAAMSPLTHPGVERVVVLLNAATDGQLRVAPMLGGSLPIAPISEVLGAPFVIVPIVNADNNQHAANENVRMREFRYGVALYAVLLSAGGADWQSSPIGR